MKINGWVVFGAFVVTFLLGAFISKIIGDRKLDKLKVLSDSIAVVAEERGTTLNHFSDSVKVVVAQLEKTQRSLLATVRVNRQVDAQLDTALILATTVADSNTILTRQVVNLRQEVLTLGQALVNANIQRDKETFRADSLLGALNLANADIIKLNIQVQGLHPRLPKLVRYSIEGAKLAGVFYAGIQWERNTNK